MSLGPLPALVMVPVLVMAVIIALPMPRPGPVAPMPILDGATVDQRGGNGRLHARPDEATDDEDAFTAPASARHTVDTRHFRMHWTSTTEDAATIAFIKEAVEVFERVWDEEIDRLGWPAPVPDAGLGGNDLVDVYFVDLSDEAYGYATVDDVSLCGACDQVHGYLVLDNDYRGFEPDVASALRSTAAHEFSHLIQFGIAYDAEGWAYESTAVWLERVVYASADARTPYLADFAALPELPLSDFGTTSGGFDRAYGAYVWNVWLADRFGPAIVRDAWLAAPDHADHMMEGYADALRQRGSLLERELVAFTAATAAWDIAGFPGEPQDYPEIARQSDLDVGSVTTVTVDHTAAYVADLSARGGSLTVTVRGPKFVAGGIALVAVGPDGVVSTADDTLFDGQSRVSLVVPDDATRVTLVVVNADPALAVPKPPGSDRPRYLNDDITYIVGVDVDPGPLRKP